MALPAHRGDANFDPLERFLYLEVEGFFLVERNRQTLQATIQARFGDAGPATQFVRLLARFCAMHFPLPDAMQPLPTPVADGLPSVSFAQLQPPTRRLFFAAACNVAALVSRCCAGDDEVAVRAFDAVLGADVARIHPSPGAVPRAPCGGRSGGRAQPAAAYQEVVARRHGIAGTATLSPSSIPDRVGSAASRRHGRRTSWIDCNPSSPAGSCTTRTAWTCCVSTGCGIVRTRHRPQWPSRVARPAAGRPFCSRRGSGTSRSWP